MSTQQTIPGIQVWDQLYESGGTATPMTALKGVTVTATLQSPSATFASPAVSLAPGSVTTTTDSNGYWTLYLPANNKITPTGTTYLIDTGGVLAPYKITVSDISVPAGGWQSSTILA